MTEAETPRRVWVVLNGKSIDQPRLRQSVAHLREQGHTIEVRVTWEAGQAVRIAREGAQQDFQVVVAAGGDGTVGEVASGLLEVPKPVRPSFGIVPLGTANDFAVSCGLEPVDPGWDLEDVLRLPAVPIDAGRMNGRGFVNLASAGLAAEVTTGTPGESKGALGKLAYLFSGLSYATSVRAWKATLKGPNFAWEGKLYGLFVGNSRTAGGGYRVCPEAYLDDGLFDVTIVPEMPFDDLMTAVGTLVAGGSPLEYAAISTERLPWLELTAERNVQVNLDGEPLRGQHFRFETVPAALRCHLKESAPLLRFQH